MKTIEKYLKNHICILRIIDNNTIKYEKFDVSNIETNNPNLCNDIMKNYILGGYIEIEPIFSYNQVEIEYDIIENNFYNEQLVNDILDSTISFDCLSENFYNLKQISIDAIDTIIELSQSINFKRS